MNSFQNVFKFLKKPVGNNLKNDPQDVQVAKRHFAYLDYLPEEERDGNGYITRALDTAIKSFQKDNGLKTDGKMNPGGETERQLFKKLTQKNPIEVFGEEEDSSAGTVGFGGNVSDIFCGK